MSGLPAKLDAFLAGCDPFMVVLAGLAVAFLLGILAEAAVDAALARLRRRKLAALGWGR